MTHRPTPTGPADVIRIVASRPHRDDVRGRGRHTSSSSGRPARTTHRGRHTVPSSRRPARMPHPRPDAASLGSASMYDVRAASYARRRGDQLVCTARVDPRRRLDRAVVPVAGVDDETIRSRSAREANSMAIRPFERPRATLTRVSSRSPRRSPSSLRPGAEGRDGADLGAGVVVEPWSPTATISSRPRTEMPSATTRPASRSWTPASVTPSRARACPALSTPAADAALDGGREVEQPQRVADLRPAAADPGGELVVGAAEVVEQLAVRRGLLERVELRAVQVLQQRVAQQVVVLGLAHDRRDGGRGRPRGWHASGAHP